MRSELETRLAAALHTAVPEPDAARRDALERELVAALPPVRRAAPRWSKWALGGGLGAALAVGACVLPSDYAAPIGHRLAIVVDAAHEDELDPETIVAFVTERYHPDELTMGVSLERVREGDVERATMRIEIDAVGEDLDTDVIWHDLVDAFPALYGARLEDEALHGMVHGTIGGRLSQQWLDVVIDRDGIDEAKRRVIEELRVQGIEGDAVVDIVDHEGDDGRHRREVRVMIHDEE